MRAFSMMLLAALICGSPLAAKTPRLDATDLDQARERTRVIPGDLCSTATALSRGATVEIDLCQAWNDYDPGAFGCSSCALPGPEVVYTLDTQAGEQLRIVTSVSAGAADVRLYLATDCADPLGTCLVASATGGAGLDITLVQGGALYLFVDTTDECGTVSVTRQEAASTASTTWGALKAIYY